MYSLKVIEKDIRRIIGKKSKLTKIIKNNTVEYQTNSKAHLKILKYMDEHPRSRLARSNIQGLTYKYGGR